MNVQQIPGIQTDGKCTPAVTSGHLVDGKRVRFRFLEDVLQDVLPKGFAAASQKESSAEPICKPGRGAKERVANQKNVQHGGVAPLRQLAEDAGARLLNEVMR